MLIAIKLSNMRNFKEGIRRLGGVLVCNLRIGHKLDFIVHLLARQPESASLLTWLLSKEGLPYLDLSATNLFDQNILHEAVLHNNQAVLSICLKHEYWGNRRNVLL